MQEISVTIVAFVVCGLFALNVLSYYSYRTKVLPDIIWVLLFGIAYGYISNHTQWGLPVIKLSEPVVFYAFIPLLIFASTQKVCWHNFRTILVPASLVASVGILISMAIVGFGVHYLFDIPLKLALLFGVVVSATDPLAISALLSKNKKIDESVKLLIEGESILNDGFVVTVFGILYALNFEGEAFSFGGASVNLVTNIVGAIILGIVIARIARFIIDAWNVDHYILSINMTLAVAYSSFLIAESIGFSGILAVFTTALAYGYKPKREDRTKVEGHHELAHGHIWDYFEYIANAGLFFLLGASVIGFAAFAGLTLYNILLAIALVFISRFMAIGVLWPVTRIDKKTLSGRDFWLMNFAGARGAVCIALLLLLPSSFEHKHFFLSIAFIMILFTLIVYPLLMQRILKNQ